ncbi:MAG: HypC/HybG/HupF family hydrogenase formation chaperone [Gammaproteobacteria bacterium]|nr:HypC/HybG/HupF family hydrogenase formation chaperone [Gammaproteobacteria bacterium]
MCLALPAQIIDIHEELTATINLAGIHKKISIELVPDVAVGDYVVVHVGYAIGKIEPEQAEQTLQLFEQMQANNKKTDDKNNII